LIYFQFENTGGTDAHRIDKTDRLTPVPNNDSHKNKQIFGMGHAAW